MIRATPLARIADLDVPTAARMIDSLGRLAPNDPVAIAGLAVALLDHPNNEQIGSSAAYQLAHAGPPGLEVLVYGLGTPKPSTQWRASYGVGEMGLEARATARRLALLLRSDSDSVAAMASWALSKAAPKFRDKSIPLLRALRFETGFTQHQAAYQVGWLGPSASFAYPFLIRMLADTSDQTRQVASDALRRAGPFARAELEKARQGTNERIRVQAMLILNSMGSE
jgi:HEAT repeat protein